MVELVSLSRPFVRAPGSPHAGEIRTTSTISSPQTAIGIRQNNKYRGTRMSTQICWSAVSSADND